MNHTRSQRAADASPRSRYWTGVAVGWLISAGALAGCSSAMSPTDGGDSGNRDTTVADAPPDLVDATALDASSPHVDASLDVTRFDALGDAGVSDGTALPCNTLTPSGPAVTGVLDTGAPAAPAGGVIADGSYDLTQLVIYVPPDASVAPPTNPTQGVLVIAGPTMQGASISPRTTLRASYLIAASGAQLTLTLTCPAGGADAVVGYTATASQLVLYSGDRTTQYTVETFVHR